MLNSVVAVNHQQQQQQKYEPETARLLKQIERVALCDPRRLVVEMIRALFGDAKAAENIVRGWFRTVDKQSAVMIPQLFREFQQKPTFKKFDLAQHNKDLKACHPVQRLARFFCYLARAPLNIQIRIHRTGTASTGAFSLGEGIRVYLLPFGGGPATGEEIKEVEADRLEFEPYLMIPVEHLDARVIEAVKVFIFRKGCLRQVTEDPTAGHITFWSLGQQAEANAAMCRQRPMLLVAAFRAFLVDLRKWSNLQASSISHHLPVCFETAKLESNLISRMCKEIHKIHASNPKHNLSWRLMKDTMIYVLTGKEHQQYSEQLGAWRHIPSDADLEQFSRETTDSWVRMNQ